MTQGLSVPPEDSSQPPRSSEHRYRARLRPNPPFYGEPGAVGGETPTFTTESLSAARCQASSLTSLGLSRPPAWTSN